MTPAARLRTSRAPWAVLGAAALFAGLLLGGSLRIAAAQSLMPSPATSATDPAATPPTATLAPGPGPGPASAPQAAPGAPVEDIRDIRGPKFVLPVWFVPAVAAALLLLAALVVLVVRLIRRRRRPRALLPHEAALLDLERIRPLLAPATVREFSTEVSNVVRGYIELRFAVTATHRTTEEFLHDLLASANAGLARHRALLSEFLHQCDLVKFAGMSLTQQNMEALHQSARAFVLETAKPDEPEAVLPAAAPMSAPSGAP